MKVASEPEALLAALNEPVSDIDTEAVESLKVLEPNRPIREADNRCVAANRRFGPIGDMVRNRAGISNHCHAGQAVSCGMLGNREEAAGIDDRVAVLVSSLKLVGDKLVLAGASKDALKAAPPFEYAN